MESEEQEKESEEQEEDQICIKSFSAAPPFKQYQDY